jgi:hypothetical protein
MATTTPNFGWPVPTSTDLVKNGATAIEALGDAIDASLVDLEGGTTGQVLAKASNTDMDFAWVAQDDSNAIQNTIVDAKGDLIAASAADVPARLAVGSNGETLVADSSTSTGLRYQAIQAAGRNVLINTDMKINQRATGLTTTSTTFVVDRFSLNYSGGTCSGEQKTFSPGAGVTGIASVENYLEYISSGQSGTSDFMRCRGTFEDVYTFAGETVTFSFYAKAASGTPKIALGLTQNFGSGGSTAVTTKMGESTLSTSWARYSITFTMPSISGKTIGAGNYNTIQFFMSAGTAVDSGIWGIGVQNNTFQFTAFQLEQGSVATPFTTATGTIQGELAACQRYFQKSYNTDVAPGTSGAIGFLFASQVASTTSAGQLTMTVTFNTRMRTTATVTVYDLIGGSGVCNRETVGVSGDTGQSANLTQQSANSFVLYGTGTNRAGLACHYTASAEL